MNKTKTLKTPGLVPVWWCAVLDEKGETIAETAMTTRARTWWEARKQYAVHLAPHFLFTLTPRDPRMIVSPVHLHHRKTTTP